jgi:predicted DNA-binding protein (MmcQ/YjbR family)
MTIETIRTICRALPKVTEDIKWGSDLCFCVAGKMFAVVDMGVPHRIAFKCTPEMFGELIEREGIIPAPYMARNMWVLEQQLGEVLERRELEALIRTSYELVVAKLPKSRRPGQPSGPKKKKKKPHGRVKTKPPRRNAAVRRQTLRRRKPTS